MRDTGLLRAIGHFGGMHRGGIRQLAAALGISSAAVSQWRRVPTERVLAVEAATGGAITRYELRPDVFGDAPKRARGKAA